MDTPIHLLHTPQESEAGHLLRELQPSTVGLWVPAADITNWECRHELLVSASATAQSTTLLKDPGQVLDADYRGRRNTVSIHFKGSVKNICVYGRIPDLHRRYPLRWSVKPPTYYSPWRDDVPEIEVGSRSSLPYGAGVLPGDGLVSVVTFIVR